MKVRKMKNFSLVASSTLILTARQSVHASGTLLVFTNFSNLVCLFWGSDPLDVLLLEMKVWKFININLDSKAKCARFGHTVGFHEFLKSSEFV